MYEDLLFGRNILRYTLYKEIFVVIKQVFYIKFNAV
jgi:hypothetical protein